MNQASARPAAQSRAHRPTLNSDGHRHPLLNLATAFTLLAGIASFVTGMIHASHIAAVALGISGFLIGLIAQMLSATREERLLIVPGIIFSFVGLALGLAHGGFY